MRRWGGGVAAADKSWCALRARHGDTAALSSVSALELWSISQLAHAPCPRSLRPQQAPARAKGAIVTARPAQPQRPSTTDALSPSLFLRTA
jgi:hypothetical protein